MPGSLLRPHDALSERSEASYGSADSRVSTKKVSFNRAVRVKQYPWTPDDHYLPDDGTAHLSLPSRRFWFKVYRVKPQEAQNGDYWRDQNETSTYNGHYSQPQTTDPWEADAARDTYDSLAPIVEDDGADHEDRSHHYSTSTSDDQHPFHRSQVKDVTSKFRDGTPETDRRENGIGYLKDGRQTDSAKQTITKNPMLSGFKAVLAKGQSKLKGQKKDAGSKTTSLTNASPERYSYRDVSPTKHSGPNYSRNIKEERIADVHESSGLPVKIPRAESPLRGRDNIERFSIRYKTNQRRSRSTGDTMYREPGVRQMTSSDKSVSTDDLDASSCRNNRDLSWVNSSHKDKSTQCNGTLLRSKPLTTHGTPRVSRSTFSNPVKTEEQNDKKGRFTSLNGSSKAKTDPRVNASTSYSLNSRSTEHSSNRNARTISQLDSSARYATNTRRTSNQIITKPRIATNSYLSQNSKGGDFAANSVTDAVKSLDSMNLKFQTTRDHSRSSAETQSAGLYERGGDLGIVPEEHSDGKQLWNNSNLIERRASSWERSTRPAPATVGYQSGRQIASQRLHGVENIVNSFNIRQGASGAIPPKTGDRYRLTTTTKDINRPSLHVNESIQSNRDLFPTASPLRNGCVPSTGDTPDTIDWSHSGFQLGPPTVDRGLVSDSECFVHQRPPLLMYIPGVSHHEKPAVEEDRMSGISGVSRGDVDDELRPLRTATTTNSYVFTRRNSVPKDCSKSWVKWKAGGKPSRQP